MIPSVQIPVPYFGPLCWLLEMGFPIENINWLGIDWIQKGDFPGFLFQMQKSVFFVWERTEPPQKKNKSDYFTK